jgi:SAM-dependent methyltransferase
MMMRLPTFLLACVCAVAPLNASHAQTPQTHEHTFSGAERWARVFDDPRRDEWQKPHEVIAALKLAADAKVADIGAGTGYFSVRLAHFVPKGRVYGVDIEPDMVRYLAARAQREHLANLTSLQGAPDDPRLPEPVDLVLIVDTYHHIGAREQYFRRLLSSLKPGARVAIIDFTAEAPMGPPPSSRVASERVRAEMDAAGYAFAQAHTFLPHHPVLRRDRPRSAGATAAERPSGLRRRRAATVGLHSAVSRLRLPDRADPRAGLAGAQRRSRLRGVARRRAAPARRGAGEVGRARCA